MNKLIALTLALSLQCNAALTYGGATSDRSNCGSNAVLDNLTAFTSLIWAYPTTLTDGRMFLSKYRGATQEGWTQALSGTGGDLQFYWERATVDMTYITNSAPLVANDWNFVSYGINQTGPSINIYRGNRTTPASAATFGTSTNGSGAYNSDAARSMFIGNVDAPTPALSFQGRIGVVMVVTGQLTIDQIKAWQFRPRMIPGTIAFYRLNGASSTQPDLSGNGNNCANTGLSQADGEPLGPFFGFDWRNQMLKFLGVYDV